MNLARINDEGQTADGLQSTFGGSWEQGFRVGAVAGAFAEIDLAPTWIFRPELLYTMKGETYDGVVSAVDSPTGEEATGSITKKLDYLEVPVLVVYRFSTSGSLRPGIFAGSAVAFELNADMAIDGGHVLPALGDPETKSVDVSLVAGAEVMFKERFFLEGRVWNGFTDLNDSGAGEAIKNQGVSFLAGIAWDLSGK